MEVGDRVGAGRSGQHARQYQQQQADDAEHRAKIVGHLGSRWAGRYRRLLNLAITAILASLIVTVQGPLPEQSLFQPAKVEFASAVAVRVTMPSAGKRAEQAAP